jgi:hypothetical protein
MRLEPLPIAGGHGHAGRFGKRSVQMRNCGPQLLDSHLSWMFPGGVGKRQVRAKHHPNDCRDAQALGDCLKDKGFTARNCSRDDK